MLLFRKEKQLPPQYLVNMVVLSICLAVMGLSNAFLIIMLNSRIAFLLKQSAVKYEFSLPERAMLWLGSLGLVGGAYVAISYAVYTTAMNH